MSAPARITAAFELAATGGARSDSMIAAINLAAELVKKRR
jgi:4-hydroxy-L-threonine phosphate dehydrogenase PdxA